jgi:uncharacterized protein with beta-barrel porin domain
MKKTTLLLAAAAGSAVLSAGAAQAGTLYIANLTQAGENPPTGAPYTGTGFLILNDAETSATVTATHNVPLSLLTGGHIHRGPAGVNGSIIFPFTPPNSPVGPLVWAIPTAEVANLKAQGLYMNFHTSVNPGGAIRGQLVRSLISTSATNSAQMNVANALDVSAGYNADLDSILMAEAVATTANRTQALDDLSGRTIYVQGRQGVEAMSGFENSLLSHAGSHKAVTGFAPFAIIGDAFGKRDADVNQAGSKVSRPSILAGFDFGAGENMTAGIGIGYADGEDKFSDGFGSAKAKTTSGQAYVSVTGDRFVVTATGGIGTTKFDTSRNLPSLARVASSNHSGKVYALAVKVSAPISVGGKATLAPYGVLDMQQAKVDGYSETGAGAAGLVVPQRTDKESAFEGGLEWNAPLGSDTLTAHLQAGWRRAIQNSGDNLAVTVAGSPVAFQTAIGPIDKDTAHLEASISGEVSPNLSISAGYYGLIGDTSTNQTIELRLSFRM